MVLTTFSGENGALTASIVDSAGTRMAAGSGHRSVEIFDLEHPAGQQLMALPLRGEDIGLYLRYADWTPEGNRAVLIGGSGTAYLIDLLQGTKRARLYMEPGALPRAALSSDGQRVFLAVDARRLGLFSGDTGKLLMSLEGHEDDLAALAIRADGQRGVSAGGREIRVWNLEDGRTIQTIDAGAEVASLAYLGTNIAVGCADGSIRLFDDETGGMSLIIEMAQIPVAAVAFSPDATRLISVAASGQVSLWNVPEGSKVRDWGIEVQMTPTREGHLSVRFEPRGRYAIAYDQRFSFTVFDTQDAEIVYQSELFPAITLFDRDDLVGTISPYGAVGTYSLQ
ncbi:MAG: hypothetical protein GC168_02475 [Candidatus Hydrogenedens sp.]|nr:hypothetical protein [Candidatus Hydrogenedens sp.]